MFNSQTPRFGCLESRVASEIRTLAKPMICHDIALLNEERFLL
jgi:hypothetical protein